MIEKSPLNVYPYPAFSQASPEKHGPQKANTTTKASVNDGGRILTRSDIGTKVVGNHSGNTKSFEERLDDLHKRAKQERLKIKMELAKNPNNDPGHTKSFKEQLGKLSELGLGLKSPQNTIHTKERILTNLALLSVHLKNQMYEILKLLRSEPEIAT